jgi:serine acetyltransferase
VTVGDRVFIGAGSIVTRDVPPETVVAGARARVLGSVEEYWPKHQAEWIDTSALTEAQKRRAAGAVRPRLKPATCPCRGH